MIDRSFKYGDRVQLTDAKGKLYSITLDPRIRMAYPQRHAQA